MQDKKLLLIIVGPTAVGKTNLSIQIATELNGEIISADSMQIYKYMDIGTAKITENEKKEIPHYLIDEVFPDKEYSVSDFQKSAFNHIDVIHHKNKLPIVVGGTGLYINSLIYDLDFTQSVSNWDLRNKYLNQSKEKGQEFIYNELLKVDPVSAKRLHINDTKRIIRALEVYHETGKPMSEFYKDFRKYNDKYNVTIIALNMDRQKLYDRINKRVDKMISDGLIDEVKKLLEMGYDEELTSMKAIGYKEIIKYLRGEYPLEEAIDILKMESRRYAKRQLTWFRREKQVHWVNIDEFKDVSSVLNYIKIYIEEKLGISHIDN